MPDDNEFILLIPDSWIFSVSNRSWRRARSKRAIVHFNFLRDNLPVHERADIDRFGTVIEDQY